MAFSNRFSFVGTPVIPKPDSKRPFMHNGETSNHSTKYRRSTFGIKESDKNMGWVELFGTQQTVIKTMDKDNNKIEIDWNDRFDEDVIANVAGYRKFILNLGEEYGGRQEFISEYDFLGAVGEWLPKYDGRIIVSGRFTKEWYKDRYTDRFTYQNIYAVTDEKVKSCLNVTLDLYYKASCLDKTDWKSDKRLLLDAYINQYINKDEGFKYIPHQCVFDASKIDENNSRHMGQLEHRLDYLEKKTKGKTYIHIPWEIKLLNGAETVEFTVDMLTDAQREQVELGLKTLNDFRPRGDIFGAKVVEYRLTNVFLKNEFANGVLNTELTENEFMENVYEPATEEKLEDVMKKATAKQSEPKKEEPPFDADADVDDDELF